MRNVFVDLLYLIPYDLIFYGWLRSKMIYREGREERNVLISAFSASSPVEIFV